MQRLVRFGVGGKARRAAQRHADELWAAGTAARATFRLEFGGWVVIVYDVPPRTDDPHGV
jgi:phage FluMu gp28-like protein